MKLQESTVTMIAKWFLHVTHHLIHCTNLFGNPSMYDISMRQKILTQTYALTLINYFDWEIKSDNLPITC